MITWMFVSSALSALVAGGGSYLFSRKLLAANSKTLLEQYKAKAKAIEYEANKLLQESKIKAKEKNLISQTHKKLLKKY